MTIVDGDGNPVEPGTPGRLVGTGLHNMAMPLLRYDVGDVASLSTEVCTCGRGLPLMGLVATLQASGVLQRLVDFAHQRSRSARSGETWIVGAASGAVLLTCHSIVAILTVSEFARQMGEKKKFVQDKRT